MQEDMSKLVRELRKETCPQRVIDETVRRISAETRKTNPFMYAIPVALAGFVLLCGLLIWWRLPGRTSTKPLELALQPDPRAGGMQAARDTEKALGVIATVLVDAGAHSETVISDRAIPPLRNGFETAKNKIIRHTEL